MASQNQIEYSCKPRNRSRLQMATSETDTNTDTRGDLGPSPAKTSPPRPISLDFPRSGGVGRAFGASYLYASWFSECASVVGIGFSPCICTRVGNKGTGDAASIEGFRTQIVGPIIFSADRLAFTMHSPNDKSMLIGPNLSTGPCAQSIVELPHVRIKTRPHSTSAYFSRMRASLSWSRTYPPGNSTVPATERRSSRLR